MGGFAEVRFKGTRKEYFSYGGAIDPTPGDWVVVEADRGEERRETAGPRAARPGPRPAPASRRAVVDGAGWGWAFVALVPGPIFGIVSMVKLRRLPESERMASGAR